MNVVASVVGHHQHCHTRHVPGVDRRGPGRLLGRQQYDAERGFVGHRAVHYRLEPVDQLIWALLLVAWGPAFSRVS